MHLYNLFPVLLILTSLPIFAEIILFLFLGWWLYFIVSNSADYTEPPHFSGKCFFLLILFIILDTIYKPNYTTIGIILGISLYLLIGILYALHNWPHLVDIFTEEKKKILQDLFFIFKQKYAEENISYQSWLNTNNIYKSINIKGITIGFQCKDLTQLVLKLSTMKKVVINYVAFWIFDLSKIFVMTVNILSNIILSIFAPIFENISSKKNKEVLDFVNKSNDDWNTEKANKELK